MAVLVPQCAWAQEKKLPRIGFLSLISLDKDPRLAAFLTGMREFGYVDGKTVSIEWRSAGGNDARLPALAEELVRTNVRLIVAVQPQAVEAARRATASIPIVFAVGQDPVGMGFAKTLSRPGGNITGTSSMVTEQAPKQVEIVRTVLPRCKRIALLLNPTNPGGSAVLRKSFQTAAAKAGLALIALEAAGPAELEAALKEAKAQRVDALIIAADAYFLQAGATIAQHALANRLPTMFVQRDQTYAGGMMSYGHAARENYHRAAYYVDRILKGANPGDLPIEQPTKFELVVNLKTAKALGVKIPKEILARADEVIQ
jgi:putative ABC transport system substrate-binding protein